MSSFSFIHYHSSVSRARSVGLARDRASGSPCGRDAHGEKPASLSPDRRDDPTTPFPLAFARRACLRPPPVRRHAAARAW